MKICVIGNSHAGALKGASASMSIAGVVFDYFVIPGGNQPRVALENDRIWPVSIDGTRTFNARTITTVDGAATNGLYLTPYDGVVISACGLSAARNPNSAYKQLHPLGYLSCIEWLKEPSHGAPKGNQLVSTAVFRAVVESHIRAHPSVKLALSLASHYAGSVYLQPWPAPSRSLKRDPGWFANLWYRERGPDAWFAFFEAQRLALETVARELGPRFILLNYPLLETLDDGFMEESLVGRDAWHSNVKYGKLVLDQLAMKIASDQP